MVTSSNYSQCSAGVGRTGAFIVIDAMLDRIKNVQDVDIYCHVTCLRAQRNYMVQTADQYVFIHEALLEAVDSGDSEIPADCLYVHVQRLTQIDFSLGCPRIELEFKVCRMFIKGFLCIFFFVDFSRMFIEFFLLI